MPQGQHPKFYRDVVVAEFLSWRAAFLHRSPPAVRGDVGPTSGGARLALNGVRGVIQAGWDSRAGRKVKAEGYEAN